MKNLFSWCRLGLLALSAAGAATPAAAQTTPAAFTPGNYVVLRVGDGTAALTNASTAVFLHEYTPGGTLVQTVALPTAVSGSTPAFALTGNSGAEGFLTRSADGRYLVVPGYNSTPGTANLPSTTSTTVNRLIGRVASNGTFDGSTRLTDAFSGGNIRSAASANGSAFYAVGNAGGVVYVPFGNAAASTTISTGMPVNDRVVSIFGGNLYVTSGSTPTYGVSQVGTGLPTTSGQTQTLLTNVVPAGGTATAASSYAFLFTDQSAAVPGNDVLYVADDGSATATPGGIQKWSLVNGAWTLNGTIGTTAAGLRGLTGGFFSVTNPVPQPVTLVATSSTSLYVLTDNAGYNAAPSTTTLPTPVATAATNTNFRGVALAPLATALAARPEATPQELALYPSPAQDVLTLALPTGLVAGHRAEVRDLLGRVVLAATLPASGQLRVAGLAPGTYLLTLDGTLTRRFSKSE